MPPMASIRKYVEEVANANEARCEILRAKSNQQKLFVWIPPDINWIKVNVDGCASKDNQAAAAGGIVRNSKGEWLGGFTHSLGACSAEEAELWGIIDGLQVAWNGGWRKVVTESDAKVIVDSIQKHMSQNPSISRDSNSLLEAASHWLTRGWEVQINHVMREGNQSADALAKMSIHKPVGLQVLSDPPGLLSSFMASDLVGITWVILGMG